MKILQCIKGKPGYNYYNDDYCQQSLSFLGCCCDTCRENMTMLSNEIMVRYIKNFPTDLLSVINEYLLWSPFSLKTGDKCDVWFGNVSSLWGRPQQEWYLVEVVDVPQNHKCDDSSSCGNCFIDFEKEKNGFILVKANIAWLNTRFETQFTEPMTHPSTGSLKYGVKLVDIRRRNKTFEVGEVIKYNDSSTSALVKYKAGPHGYITETFSIYEMEIHESYTTSTISSISSLYRYLWRKENHNLKFHTLWKKLEKKSKLF